ncbi:MAG: HAD family phosphatase [Bacilli bacterium]|nr:HAD family phosphatase [Bacilli bacterium]
MINFNNKNIKLVIFDLDGTLIASTSLWSDIDKNFFKKRNMEVPEDYGKAIAHLGLKSAAKYTVENYFPNEKETDVIKEWHDLSIEAYSKDIPLKPHAKEILDFLMQNGVIIALATANSKELYEPCLSRLDIAKYFSFIIDVNSVKEGKNSPEIYDRICTHFNVSRAETLIFEDMLLPIKTAYKAGYNVVAIYDKHSIMNEEESINNSHLYIKDFDDFLSIYKK